MENAFPIYDYMTKVPMNEGIFASSRERARAEEWKWSERRSNAETYMIVLCLPLFAAGLLNLMATLLVTETPWMTVRAIRMGGAIVALLAATGMFAAWRMRRARGKKYEDARANRKPAYLSQALQANGAMILLFAETLDILRRQQCELVGEIVSIDGGELHPDGGINGLPGFGISYKHLKGGFGRLAVTVGGKPETSHLPLWTTMRLVGPKHRNPLRGLPMGAELEAAIIDRLGDMGLLDIFQSGNLVEVAGGIWEALLFSQRVPLNLLTEIVRAEEERTPLSDGSADPTKIVNMRNIFHIRMGMVAFLMHQEARIRTFRSTGGVPMKFIPLQVSAEQEHLIETHIINRK